MPLPAASWELAQRRSAQRYVSRPEIDATWLRPEFAADASAAEERVPPQLQAGKKTSEPTPAGYEMEADVTSASLEWAEVQEVSSACEHL